MSNPTFAVTPDDFWSTMLFLLKFNEEKLNKEAEERGLLACQYLSIALGAWPSYDDYQIDRIAVMPVRPIAHSTSIAMELVISDRVPAKNPFLVDQDSILDALQAVLNFNLGYRHTESMEAGVPPLVFLGNQLGAPNNWQDKEFTRSFVALQPTGFRWLGGRRKIGGRLMLDLFTLDD